MFAGNGSEKCWRHELQVSLHESRSPTSCRTSHLDGQVNLDCCLFYAGRAAREGSTIVREGLWGSVEKGSGNGNAAPKSRDFHPRIGGEYVTPYDLSHTPEHSIAFHSGGAECTGGGKAASRLESREFQPLTLARHLHFVSFCLCPLPSPAVSTTEGLNI